MSLAPIGLRSSATVDGEFVQSMGALSEISPQSQFSANFRLDVPLEARRRSSDANPTYPWHGVQDLHCLRNQWAFRADGATSGYADVHDSTPAIFTVANGLHLSMPISFVGIIDKTVIAGDNKDPSVSCTVGGIRTGVNTGHHLIPLGYGVIWDWPLVDRRGSVAYPKFKQNGVSDTAFMFRTLPLRRDRVYGVLRSISSIFFNACNTASTIELAPNRNNWEAVRDEISQEPGRIATVVNAMATAHHADVIISSTSDTRDVLKRYVNFLLVTIGAEVDFNTHTVENDANDILGGTDDSDFSSSSVYSAASGSRLRPRKRALLEYKTTALANASLRQNPIAFVDYLFKFYAELENILKQRYMGEAMATSDAGGRLDLNIKSGKK